jgi:8-oxo-dGTP diphosphatase
VVLSPVLATATHPGAKTLGWENFKSLAQEYSMPVFALGGMRLDSIDTAIQNGGHGVALLSDIW